MNLHVKIWRLTHFIHVKPGFRISAQSSPQHNPISFNANKFEISLVHQSLLEKKNRAGTETFLKRKEEKSNKRLFFWRPPPRFLALSPLSLVLSLSF